MRRPPRPGETIVTRLRGVDVLIPVQVVKHSGVWIMFGLRVRSRTNRPRARVEEHPRKKPRLVWHRNWRVHRFDEGRTWVRSMNSMEVRAIQVAEALR